MGKSDRLTDAQLRETFVAFAGQWWGPPVVLFGPRKLDGRRRLAALKYLGGDPNGVPTIRVESPRQAARALYRAGEYCRVVALFSDALDLRAGTRAEQEHLRTVLMVSDASALHAPLQRRAHLERRNVEPKLRRSRHAHERRRALKAVVALRERALEAGEPIDLDALGAVLEPWL